MSIFKGTTEPKKIYYGDSITLSDMQGPCPDGFHIPLITERQAVKTIWTTLGGSSSGGTNFGIALKLPFAGSREDSTSNTRLQGEYGYYWSSSPYDDRFALSLLFYGSSIDFPTGFYRTNGMSIRCFRDSPIVPTSSWTKLYGTSIEAGGIFWSSTDGLISLSSDGQTWITMTDKNLGASTVWNSGDTLSETNCGKYYQWGNNYGFPRTGSVTKSGTQVDASTYGPGNYYSSSTYIAYNGRWDTTDNRNLRGGTSQGTWEKAIEIKAVYLGTNKVRPSGPDKDYLCFTANTAGSTVTLNKTGSPTAVTLETSTDGSTWTTYTFGNTITLTNIGDKVYWRNTSETDTRFSLGNNSNYFRFTMTGSIKASGDTTSLLNRNMTTTLSDYCFTGLFYNCDSLTESPKIPVTTLNPNCCYQMFAYCDNLEVLPKLYSTTLQNYCYYRMFYNCPKIKLSSTQTGDYQTAYRIPTEGTGTNSFSYSLYQMFNNTGGTFTGTPTINTTYYTSNTVV